MNIFTNTNEGRASSDGSKGPNKGKQEREIRYTLDGEPQTTTEREMTAEQILRVGGVDPAKYYLVLQKDEGNVVFKDNPLAVVKLHNNMKFLANYRGATTVS
ncbi:hypothetical protein H7F15_12110 [Pontibacter sp. Tf4]|uniref:hypothetical protein n=1 Tax=Pontibacter sp. Tf4 TaxID=2761620 RepID=UPI00162418C9|nr:hypothetical protein [Pontibacter sp. Tf4]MBB6611786.1 hypothetical protein [Pontibacter sp. Tf4]